MTIFRKMDRIRKAAAKARRSFRHVRSSYRQSMYITAAAIAAIALAALGGGQYEKSHMTEYYQVMLKDKPVGEVSSRDKVEQWLAAKSAELEQMNSPVRQALDENQVTYRFQKAYKKRTDDQATLADLAKQIHVHPVGVQVILDGRVVGIVRDQKTADDVLKRVMNKFVPAAAEKVQTAALKSAPRVMTLAFREPAATPASAKPERKVTSVSFVEEVRTAEVKIADSQLSNPDQLYHTLITGNPSDISYTVKKGDCLGCIAAKMNVSPALIYEKNPWIVDDLLQVGDTLDLTEQKPLLSVKSVEQVTQVEPIEATVEYKKSKEMRVGQSKVLREGRDGQKRVIYRLTKKNGSLLEEQIVSEQVLQNATSTLILKGSKMIMGEGTGKFSWPVDGHRITSYLGQRWGRMHKGIDIVGRSSIRAADNGIVEFAGYKSGGLGNMVIMDHKNGYKTIYGHLKTVKAKKGQIVQKGDTIGIMGSTGHSTGTHLHFEIHYNDKLKNPTSFL